MFLLRLGNAQPNRSNSRKKYSLGLIRNKPCGLAMRLAAVMPTQLQSFPLWLKKWENFQFHDWRQFSAWRRYYISSWPSIPRMAKKVGNLCSQQGGMCFYFFVWPYVLCQHETRHNFFSFDSKQIFPLDSSKGFFSIWRPMAETQIFIKPEAGKNDCKDNKEGYCRSEIINGPNTGSKRKLRCSLSHYCVTSCKGYSPKL